MDSSQVVLQVEKETGLGQSLPMLSIRAFDVTGKPFTGPIGAWIKYEKAPVSKGVMVDQNFPIMLKTDAGRAIIRIMPQGEEYQTAYVAPEDQVVDPSKGSKTISFTIFKHRGEVEPLEMVGNPWPIQVAIGLGIGTLAFAAAYGIYYYFVKGR